MSPSEPSVSAGLNTGMWFWGRGRIEEQWESEPSGVSLVPIPVAFPLCLILDRVLNFSRPQLPQW